MRVMDGFCGTGRVTISVLSLELGESEDEEDGDEVEVDVMSSSLSGSSSEASALDSEVVDSDAVDSCEVLPSESDPASDLVDLAVGEEPLFLSLEGDVIWGADRAFPAFRRLAVTEFEVPSSSDKLFLFIAVVP